VKHQKLFLPKEDDEVAQWMEFTSQLVVSKDFDHYGEWRVCWLVFLHSKEIVILLEPHIGEFWE